MEIDRIDRAILMQLQKNNQIRNLDLAEQVGLSAPACLKRVKRLRESGVILQDISIINSQLAGNSMTLIVSVEMERDRADIYDNFKQKMYEENAVMQCYQISGQYDFMLVTNIQDIERYEQFVERVFHTDLNIRKFHTAIALRTVKQSTTINLL